MPTHSRVATRQAWVDRLVRFGQASQTVAQFCAVEGVSVASFYQWRRKLRPDALATAPQFVPVDLPTSELTAPMTIMSVELPGGIRVRLEVTGSVPS